MKQCLLATSVWASAVLMSTAAFAEGTDVNSVRSSAAPGATLTLGGTLEFRADFYDLHQPGLNHHDFQTEADINVNLDAKAENGLKYGAEIGIRNQKAYEAAGTGTNGVGTSINEGSTVVVDRAFAYAQSDVLGKVLAGDHKGAADQMSVYAPTVGLEQIDGRFVETSANVNGTSNGVRVPPVAVRAINSDVSTKITYFTPTFHGVQAGVSYAPEGGSYGQSLTTTDYREFGLSDYRDWVEGGVTYQNAFDRLGVLLGAGVVTADAKSNEPVFLGGAPTGPANSRNFTAFQIGGQLSYGSFKTGGSYVDNGQYLTTAGDNKSQTEYNFGVGYENGPFGVALQYSDAQGYRPVIDAQNISVPTYVNSSKLYGGGMAYTIAPGFVAEADLLLFNDRVVGQSTVNGYVATLATKISF